MMSGKAGLVTGAAGGIGRASALAFATEGAAVVVSDLASRRSDAEESVRTIEQAGGRASFFACDVASAGDAEGLVKYTLDTYGGLDFAHNNAGIQATVFLADTDESDFDRIIAVNLKGVWQGMRFQIPAMAARGGGSIVNTSSLAGLIGAPGLSAYVASKHGVVGLTKAAALEYAPQNIRVNALCPGAVRTPIIEGLPRELQDSIPDVQAIKRYADPGEIGAAAVWLCSEQAAFITGIALPLDGGAAAGFALPPENVSSR
jgi:NAD(P)-dependent dehydrogenase (short-subunit alcohol dehydrogenase family)